MEEFGALVMERVEERRIMSSGVPERQRIRAFVAIGRICRRWHEIDADVVEGAVVMSPDDITTAIRGDAARLGDFGLGPMKATWWPGILDELVPDDLDVALVATHGDLHLGNVLMTGSFDPLFVDAALVRAPAIHDVAHLSTSIRTSRAALTGGVANRLRVERRVSALMAGFGLHDRRLFALDELAIMLDQWSDVRTDLAMGQGRRVRAVGVRLADRLFSTELERWYDRVVSIRSDSPT
ncbi:phosphotransferase [Ilumatobacter sp.]|uniref:phosphotransferase n=1 Tax=Ilumatobacter sp. TaxID=1967498 RepID=UPI0032973CBF